MGVSIDAELKALERHVMELRIEYERFFCGDLKTPPLGDRRKLEAFLRRVSNQDVDKQVERFRLQAIQSRYNAFTELWEKRLRAREEGLPFGGVRPLAAKAPAPAAPPANATDSGSVKVAKRVDFTPLFERYRDARVALGEDVSKLSYPRFEELIRKQIEEIKRRTGSTRLVFEVKTVDGRARLVGRPAPSKGRQ